MSARTFDIGKSKKFGNVKISNSPDKIVVTLHQTDVVVFDKNKKTVRITSGGWQTPTTKTAINNALEQIEKMTGLSLGRVSQVKGKWFIEGIEFRDGMVFAARRGTKKNPMGSTPSRNLIYLNADGMVNIHPNVPTVQINDDYYFEMNDSDFSEYLDKYELELEDGKLLDAEDGFEYGIVLEYPVRRNPESRATELYNNIMKEFSSEKHRSWDVFDYRDGEIEIEDYVKSLKSGEDIGTDDFNLMDAVTEMSTEAVKYWLDSADSREDFEKLEEIDHDLAWELFDELRFKFEELANFNWKFPSPLFVTDPNSLEGYKAGSRYYSEDNYLMGPYNAGKDAKNELKKVIKLGMKHGFSKADCEEVYSNSQGGTLGIAIITDESEELYEAVMRDQSISISGTCVLYIHDGMNGSGHYVEKGNHTIKVKKAKDLVNMIDYGSYSLGDVFGTSDWKY